MTASRSSWPLVLALLALVGFAVAHHAGHRQAQHPSRTPPSPRLCQVNGKPCSSVERLQSIRGLRFHQRP
jgi:hypothetical protein